MIKYLCYFACALLYFPVVAESGERREQSEPKVVSGMSIVGNDETPKSLYIVPWKNTEVGKEVNFTSSVLNEELRPVDKIDFIRELDFYRNSNPN